MALFSSARKKLEDFSQNPLFRRVSGSIPGKALASTSRQIAGTALPPFRAASSAARVAPFAAKQGQSFVNNFRSSPQQNQQVSNFSQQRQPAQTDNNSQFNIGATTRTNRQTSDPFGNQQSRIDDLIKRQTEAANKRQQQIEQGAQERIGQLGQLRDERNQLVQSQVPGLQSNLQDFIGRSNQFIGNLGQASQDQIAAIEAQRGKQLRQQAQANRENTGNLQSIFAGLGTLDSSSFGRNLVGQNRGFEARQAETLEAQTRDINAAQRDLAQAKFSAQNAINDEVLRFNDAIRNIRLSLVEGSDAYNQAIANVQQEAQSNIAAIQNGLFDLENNLTNQLAQSGLKQFEISQKQAADSQGANDLKEQALDVALKLFSEDTKPITGRFRGVIPGTKAVNTRALFEQLQALLSLENRTLLKGSGTISDFESRVLEQAASRLRPEMSNDDFRQAVNEIVLALSGELDQGQQASQQSNNQQVDPGLQALFNQFVAGGN